MLRLANYLQKIYNSNVHITGSGTTALYIILCALGFKNNYIAIPTSVCVNVPLAIFYSGNIPIFLDIEKDTLGLSPESVNSYQGDLDAVVAVHAYGNICKIDEISDLCKKKDILLIEDCALSQGIESDKKKIVGSYGDIILLSFGSGKIVDAGHGGAILTEDDNIHNELAKVEKNFSSLTNEKHKKIARLSSEHTVLYNKYFLSNNLSNCSEFWDVARKQKDAFLYKFSTKYEELILSKLKKLKENLDERKEKARVLKRELEDKSPYITIHWPVITSLWRFNIFIQKKRNKLFCSLLYKKYKVSTWYPSVDIFFSKRNNENVGLFESDLIGEQIMNIWVNDEVDNEYLKDISKDILSFFN